MELKYRCEKYYLHQMLTKDLLKKNNKLLTHHFIMALLPVVVDPVVCVPSVDTIVVAIEKQTSYI